MTTTADPMGFSLDTVVPWLEQHVADLAAPFVWEKLPGGHSNLTYRVADANGRRFVIRRPPIGELLPGAHDMWREFRVMSALWPTPVPVPEPLAFCDDESVTGSRFYVMGVVPGRTCYSAEEVDGHVPVDRRATLADSFIDVLAELHALDPDEIGLGDLGRPDGYVARQLKRWYGSWTASQTCDRPQLDRLHDFLGRTVPTEYVSRVVHGDYGMHNCIVHSDGYVSAAVDWEICTLGDPLADVAYVMNGWETVATPGAVAPPSSAEGFPNREYLLERYCQRTGVAPASIGPYLAFNDFKTACIIDGVLARYLKGMKSTEGVDLEALNTRRDLAIERGVLRARDFGFTG